MAYLVPKESGLMEGHGVDPDIVVDNPPHASFEGRDAQLQAGIEHLQKLIREKPMEAPAVPRYPDKSLRDVQAMLSLGQFRNMLGRPTKNRAAESNQYGSGAREK